VTAVGTLIVKWTIVLLGTCPKDENEIDAPNNTATNTRLKEAIITPPHFSQSCGK